MTSRSIFAAHSMQDPGFIPTENIMCDIRTSLYLSYDLDALEL